MSLDPVEAGLLAGVMRGDPDARIVYADWLESTGQLDRAEILRLQLALRAMPPADPDRAPTRARLCELAEPTELAWRVQIGDPVVEACTMVMEFACTNHWGAMTPTDEPTVRSCTACKEAVRYCADEEEAIAYARSGQCVVVDIGTPRQFPSLRSLMAPGQPAQPATLRAALEAPSPPGMRAHARVNSRLYTCRTCYRASVEPRCRQCGKDLA